MNPTASDWAIGVLAAFVLLFLMAYLDSKQSETGALQLSARSEMNTDQSSPFPDTEPSTFLSDLLIAVVVAELCAYAGFLFACRFPGVL